MNKEVVFNPLVSIVVITYNSAKYVIETLESAQAQTYQNIELIISDDGSTDNTVELCRNWIEANKERFVRAELIASESNTGIPENCNRGIRAATGKWIKLIAGDDLLLSNAITCFINFTNETGAEVVVSRYQSFKNLDGNRVKLEIYPREEIINSFFDKDAGEQYSILLKKNYSFIMGLFFKREIAVRIGGFDERYRLLEDLPFLFRIAKSGNKFYFLPEITALYRQHNTSVTKTKLNGFSFNPLFIEDQYRVYKELIRPHCSKTERLAGDYRYMVYHWLIRNKIYSVWLTNFLLKIPLYLYPHNYIYKIKSFVKNKR